MESGTQQRDGNEPTAAPLRVTLVNDYEIIVQGLQRMLEPFGDRIQIVETEVGGLPSLPTDIALFDTFGGRRYSLARVHAMARDRAIGNLAVGTSFIEGTLEISGRQPPSRSPTHNHNVFNSICHESVSLAL
jgi:hypothetical protein